MSDHADCPSLADLESYLDEGEPEGPVRAHVSACGECRGMIKDIRSNNELLGRLVSSRVAYESDAVAGDEEVRERAAYVDANAESHGEILTTPESAVQGGRYASQFAGAGAGAGNSSTGA